jgi:hypothetical protein
VIAGFTKDGKVRVKALRATQPFFAEASEPMSASRRENGKYIYTDDPPPPPKKGP